MKTRCSHILGLAVLLLVPATIGAEPPVWDIYEAVETLAPGSVHSVEIAVKVEGTVETVGLVFHTSQPGALQYAEKVGDSPFGPPETVFTTNNNSLAYAFAFDPLTGEATIAYTAWGVRPVYFTRRLAADSWSTETIESRASRLDEEIDMVYDAAGRPWVLFSGKGDKLTVAQKVGATWQKETISPDRARWKSIAAGPAEYPNVAVGFDADGDDNGRLDSILYTDLDSNWSAILVSEDGAQAIFPMVSIDPTDGTPTMGYERFTTPSQYRLARWVDELPDPGWALEEIVMPTPTSIADTFLSKPIYSTDGRVLTSFSGPDYVHLAQRSPGDEGQWMSDYTIVYEEGADFDSFLALSPVNNAPYVAFFGSSNGSIIYVASLDELPSIPSCQGDGDCNDGIFCTTDVCQSNGFCANTFEFGCYPNGICEEDELCGSHPLDCGDAYDIGPQCGNGICEPGEDCSCAADCREIVVTPSCGDGICQPSVGESCRTCSRDCAGKLKGKPSKQFCCGDDVSCDDPRCQEDAFECSDTGSICCRGGFDCDDPRCSDDGFVCSSDPANESSCCGNGVCEAFETAGTCEIDVLVSDPGFRIKISYEHHNTAGDLVTGITGEAGSAFPNLRPGVTLQLYDNPGGFNDYPDVAECRSTCSGLVQAYYHDSLSAADPGAHGPWVGSGGCSRASEYGYHTECCIESYEP